MKRKGMTLKPALGQIIRVRPQVSPNAGPSLRLKLVITASETSRTFSHVATRLGYAFEKGRQKAEGEERKGCKGENMWDQLSCTW